MLQMMMAMMSLLTSGIAFIHYILFLNAFFYESVTREAKWHHQRIKWEAHVVQLQLENLFKRTYRMTLQSFQKLTRILEKNIVADESCCPVHEYIYPEIVVAVGLRYLSGGKCLDLKTGYGLSLTSVYRCQNLYIYAVNVCPELDINMPAGHGV